MKMYYLDKSKTHSFELQCPIMDIGIEPTKTYCMPVLDQHGINTGRSMRVKHGSELYRWMIDQYGVLPSNIQILDEQ